MAVSVIDSESEHDTNMIKKAHISTGDYDNSLELKDIKAVGIKFVS